MGKKINMSTVRSYLSLIKFSHTIFAMPFALIGFFLGKIYIDNTPIYLFDYNGFFLMKLALVVLCMVFARSAAMAFNRYLDRSFDAKNPRTAIREIPAGILKANNVLLFTIANCLLFIACCYFINELCFYLSPVALFVVLGYSYTKKIYSALSFDSRPGIKSCSDRCLPRSNREIRFITDTILTHSFILGERV